MSNRAAGRAALVEEQASGEAEASAARERIPRVASAAAEATAAAARAVATRVAMTEAVADRAAARAAQAGRRIGLQTAG